MAVGSGVVSESRGHGRCTAFLNNLKDLNLSTG
jgi:hypothetical protein